MDPASPAAEKCPRSSVLAYASTALVAAGNIAAAVLVAAILARSWSMSDFLLYSSCNRYLNLLFCITSFSVGYGIVRFTAGAASTQSKRVLATAVVGSLSLCAVLFIVLQIFAGEICSFLSVNVANARLAVGLTFVWVVGQSLLHIVLAHLRATRQYTLANFVHFFGKTVALVGASLAVWQLAGAPVYGYYAGVGALVIAGCAVGVLFQRAPLSLHFDPGLGRALAGYSSSRFLDALLKHAAGAVLLTMLFALSLNVLAGQVALFQTLLRGLESICQPLVLLVFSDYLRLPSRAAARRQVQATWNALVLSSVLLLPVAMLAARPLLGLWLGEQFLALGGEFTVAAFGFAPAMAIVLLRGYLDAEFHFSPIAVLNGVTLVLLISVTGAMYALGELTLLNVVLLLAASRWLQLVAVFWLLKRTHQLRLFDALEARSTMRRIAATFTA